MMNMKLFVQVSKFTFLSFFLFLLASSFIDPDLKYNNVKRNRIIGII